MNILDILKKAETDLREAIAEAARAGDYRTVDLGRSVAVSVQELIEKASGRKLISEKSTGADEENEEKKKHKKLGRQSKPEGLPKIEIRNGSLIRTGWSKKKREKYEHKVPHTAFSTIVNTMSAMAKERSGPFMAEQLINKLNAEDSMPGYQVYVVLAALREWNLITQVGREGYNISPDVAEKAQNKWTELTDK